MDKNEVLDRIKAILDQSRIGVMSTIDGDKPNARYMVFYNDDFTLYTKTSEETPKFEEVEKNPNTHIMLGYNEGNNKAYLEISGTVQTVDDKETIDWLWDSQDKTYFNGKDDDDLVILKVIPENIRVMNDDDLNTTEINL